MVWVRLDDHFTEDPKIAGLSDSAFALWVAGIAYSNRNLTDGYIPGPVGLGQLRYCDGNAVPFIRELEEVGLWHPLGHQAGGWSINNFAKYQPTKAMVEAEHQAKQSAGRAGGQASAQARASASGQPKSNPVPVPVPVTPKSSTLPRVQIDGYFAVFWEEYPRKVGKPEAKRAFEKAIARASPEDIILGAKRLRADPNREQQFTPHPSTWLNRDGWNDEPEPVRSRGGRPPDPPRPIDPMIADLQIKEALGGDD